MTRVQFPIDSGAYALPQVDQSCQRLVNLYPQRSEGGARSQSMLVPTPGLKRIREWTANEAFGPIVALWTARNQMYALSLQMSVGLNAGGNISLGQDATVWRCGVQPMPAPGMQWGMEKVLGDVGATLGRATRAVVLTQGIDTIIVTDTGRVGMLNSNGSWFLFDPGFDTTKVTTGCVINMRYVLAGIGNNQYWYSDPGKGDSWKGSDTKPGLNYAVKEGSPDPIVAVLNVHNQLWLFGSETIEVHADTGDNDNPFARVDGAVIEYGCVAPKTVKILANAPIWIGRDRGGAVACYTADGYTPRRVSTDALDEEMQDYRGINDAFAWTYSDSGHEFYCVSFPAADKTWCYDVSTSRWHERCWTDDATSELHRHRCGAYLHFAGLHIMADNTVPRLYVMTDSATTDDGVVPWRIVSLPMQSDMTGGSRIFHSRVEADFDVGMAQHGPSDGPLVYMRHSDNGGRDWSPVRECPVGRHGDQYYRAAWNRIGSSRRRAYEIAWRTPERLALLAVRADIETGGN